MDATLHSYIDKLNQLNFKEMYENDFFLTYFGGMVLMGMKILPDAVFQILRLADIDHLARFVLHDVHAGVVGQGL